MYAYHIPKKYLAPANSNFSADVEARMGGDSFLSTAGGSFTELGSNHFSPLADCPSSSQPCQKEEKRGHYHIFSRGATCDNTQEDGLEAWTLSKTDPVLAAHLGIRDPVRKVPLP